MHRLGRLKFTTEHTPFSFPVFVVWKPDASIKPTKSYLNYPDVGLLGQ